MQSAVKAVSVIIPVFNDASRLKKCLQALEDQTFDEPYEVIVVDNGSSDDPGAVVAEHSKASMVFESKRGSYAARNKGITTSQGSVLAFTDSDCIPASDWLATGIDILRAKPNTLVAGQVSLFAKDPNKPRPAEAWEKLHGFPQKRYVERHSYGATANMMAPRAAFDAAGLFNAELLSSGDSEWGKRAAKAGWRAQYFETVLVEHPCRESLKDLRKKIIRLHTGKTQVRRNAGTPLLTTREAIKLFKPPVRSLVRDIQKVEPGNLRTKAAYFTAVCYMTYVNAVERLRVTYLAKQPGGPLVNAKVLKATDLHQP